MTIIDLNSIKERIANEFPLGMPDSERERKAWEITNALSFRQANDVCVAFYTAPELGEHLLVSSYEDECYLIGISSMFRVTNTPEGFNLYSSGEKYKVVYGLGCAHPRIESI